MSKLRADITWNHRVNSNSPILTPLNIIPDIENQINDDENLDENPDENPNENPENQEEDQEEDEEEDLANLEKEFGNYLQGWTEMLEEETFRFQNDEDNEIDEITDITHPAIDPNAKWNLDSLFKKLELSF